MSKLLSAYNRENVLCESLFIHWGSDFSIKNHLPYRSWYRLKMIERVRLHLLIISNYKANHETIVITKQKCNFTAKASSSVGILRFSKVPLTICETSSSLICQKDHNFKSRSQKMMVKRRWWWDTCFMLISPTCKEELRAIRCRSLTVHMMIIRWWTSQIMRIQT